MNKALYDFYVIDMKHRAFRRECGIDFAAEKVAQAIRKAASEN